MVCSPMQEPAAIASRSVELLRVVPLLPDSATRILIAADGTLSIAVGGPPSAAGTPLPDQSMALRVAQEHAGTECLIVRGGMGPTWLLNGELRTPLTEHRYADSSRLIVPTASAADTRDLAPAARLLAGWFGPGSPSLTRLTGTEHGWRQCKVAGIAAPQSARSRNGAGSAVPDPTIWVAVNPRVGAAALESVSARAQANVATWWSRLLARPITVLPAGGLTAGAASGPPAGAVVVNCNAYRVALPLELVRVITWIGLSATDDVRFNRLKESLFLGLNLLAAIHAERVHGLIGLCALEPRSTAQTRALAALTAVMGLPHLSRTAMRQYVDVSFAAAVTLTGLTIVLRCGSAPLRGAITSALGARRAERLSDPLSAAALARHGAVVGDVAAEALAQAFGALAARRGVRGQAMPDEVDQFIYRRYVMVQRDRSRNAYERLVAQDGLAQLLEEALLSQLRRVLRALPRATLIDAGAAGPESLVLRLSAAFGRAGRRLFAEDVAARRAQIERNEYYDFTRFILARRTVAAAVRRVLQVAPRP